MTTANVVSLLGKIAAGLALLTDVLPPKYAGLAYLISSCVKNVADYFNPPVTIPKADAQKD